MTSIYCATLCDLLNTRQDGTYLQSCTPTHDLSFPHVVRHKPTPIHETSKGQQKSLHLSTTSVNGGNTSSLTLYFPIPVYRLCVWYKEQQTGSAKQTLRKPVHITPAF